MFNSTCAQAIFCCIMFLGKSQEIFNYSTNLTQEKLKPIQSHGNVYNTPN